jgi:2OG-Fe(II) oxygenase superfamily
MRQNSPGTLDSDLLASWIQPQHLEHSALEEYQQTFTTHPARMICIKNFLIPEVAQRLSNFLSKEAIFRPEFGIYSIEEAVTEEQYDAVPDVERYFRMRRMVGTHPQFMMSRNALTYVRFRQLFQHQEFKAFFETISSLPLASSEDFGSHLMLAGDFLRPHTDNNKNRQLALVLYLSPGWDRQCGGNLHFFNSHLTIEVIPEYNSMLAFDVLVNADHEVTVIDNGMRLSIGGWYHKREQDTST